MNQAKESRYQPGSCYQNTPLIYPYRLDFDITAADGVDNSFQADIQSWIAAILKLAVDFTTDGIECPIVDVGVL